MMKDAGLDTDSRPDNEAARALRLYGVLIEARGAMRGLPDGGGLLANRLEEEARMALAAYQAEDQ